MSESERRRGYRYNHVLIETARILDPQFSDAVVYLTGAQIEMLRNVTQYLNRLDTYVTEYNPGYYITPTVEDYDTILAIVADLEEVLMGNPNTIWGYSDRWEETLHIEGIGAGFTDVDTDPVPEGYVYVLEHWMIAHTYVGTKGVYLHIMANGHEPILYQAPSLSGYDYVVKNARITMKEGDYVSFRVYDLPAATFGRLRVLGYKMAVP